MGDPTTRPDPFSDLKIKYTLPGVPELHLITTKSNTFMNYTDKKHKTLVARRRR